MWKGNARFRKRERFKAQVKRRRAALIAKLGGRCAKCGGRWRLEFNHPKGRDWDPARLNQRSRIARYEREAARGLVDLGCRRCNAGFDPKRGRGNWT